MMITRLICVAALTVAADFGFENAHQALNQTETAVTVALDDRDEQIAELVAVNSAYAATIEAQSAQIADLQAQLAACLEGQSSEPVSAGAILLGNCFTKEGLAYGVQHGALDVPCIYESVQGEPRDGVIDEAMARLLIERRVPDVNYDGLLVLDIEKPLSDMFLSDDPAVRHEADRIALSNVAFLRYLRPFAKIAWWGWPNLPWRLADEDGKERVWANVSQGTRDAACAKLAASRLNDELDWFFPSAYMLYGEPNEWYWKVFGTWATARCELAIEIAGGRPVALCVSPRSQLTYEGYSKVLYPLDIWERYIQIPIDAGVGVGWWDNAALTPEQEMERIDALKKALGGE